MRTSGRSVAGVAEHGIGAEVEVIAADRVNQARERVLASDVRYRFVIDTATSGWLPANPPARCGPCRWQGD